MNSMKKGGIATVITVIIMVGIVLALIISTVIPMANKSRDTAETGVEGLNELQGIMGGGEASPDPIPPAGFDGHI